MHTRITCIFLIKCFFAEKSMQIEKKYLLSPLLFMLFYCLFMTKLENPIEVTSRLIPSRIKMSTIYTLHFLGVSDYISDFNPWVLVILCTLVKYNFCFLRKWSFLFPGNLAKRNPVFLVCVIHDLLTEAGAVASTFFRGDSGAFAMVPLHWNWLQVLPQSQ